MSFWIRTLEYIEMLKNAVEMPALWCLVPIAHLSDEGVKGDKNGFTGAFVGLSVQDRLYEKNWAEVDYFDYRED